MRSRTPSTRSLGTNGSGLVTQVTCLISSSERPSTRPMARMISVVSSNPLVVMKPTLQPLWVINALVATVLPCLKSGGWPSNSEVSTPRVFAASPTASMTPREKSSGVVDAFAVQTSPESPSTTTSVKVPPVSTPIMYCFLFAMNILSSVISRRRYEREDGMSRRQSEREFPRIEPYGQFLRLQPFSQMVLGFWARRGLAWDDWSRARFPDRCGTAHAAS